jgi:hypothetical protein
VLPSRNRVLVEVCFSTGRASVWRRFGDDLPVLRDVGLCLLSAHATSAATERKWPLWGSMYLAARDSPVGHHWAWAVPTH